MSIHDIRDARRALVSTSRVGLAPQAAMYLRVPPWKAEALADEADLKGDISSARIPRRKLLRYNAQDCVYTAQVWERQREELYNEEPADSPRRVRLYKQQLRLAQVAGEMSFRGFPVDQARRKELAKELDAIARARTEELMSTLHGYCPAKVLELDDKSKPGPYLRISRKGGVNEHDLRALLFSQCKRKGLPSFDLPVPEDDHSWTESGLPSVAKNALLTLWAQPGFPNELKPILRACWKVDAPIKALSTFVMSEKLDNRIGPDGYLHAAFNSCGTETGRWSCSDFNLFNLSEEKSAEDADLRGELPSMRSFLRAPKGYTIVHRDFSGIELEMLAEVSGDKLLRKMLDSGHDVHSMTVVEWFGLPFPEIAPGKKLKDYVPKGIRRQAKVVRFASNYRAGLPTVFLKVLESDQEAKWENVEGLHKLFVKHHTGITGGDFGGDGWWQKSQEQAETVGYNDTALMERRRYYPAGEKPKPTDTANYRVQGTAADVANITMVGYDESDGMKHGLYYQLKKHFPKAWLAMHTYDSFDVICPERDAKGVDDLTLTCMSRAHRVGARDHSFPSDGKTAPYWNEV